MEPAYATYQPGLLHDVGGGMMLPQDADVVQYTPLPGGWPGIVGPRRFEGYEGYEGFGQVDTAGPQTVDLPNGTSDVVADVTPDGMILTAGGWQSMVLPGGAEQWVNVHTGQVMHADGTITESPQPSPVVDYIATAIQNLTASLPGMLKQPTTTTGPTGIVHPPVAATGWGPLIPLAIVGGIAYFLFRGK